MNFFKVTSRFPFWSFWGALVSVCLLQCSITDTPVYPTPDPFKVQRTQQSLDIYTLRLYNDTGISSQDGITTDPRIVMRVTRGTRIQYFLDTGELQTLGVGTGSDQIFTIDLPYEIPTIITVVVSGLDAEPVSNSLLVEFQYITPISDMFPAIITSDLRETTVQDPHTVVFDRQGHMYISDPQNHRIQVYEADTKAYVATLGTPGTPGSDSHEFHTPKGMYMTPQGLLYIADQGNNRIQIYNTNRHFISSITNSTLIAPCMIAVLEVSEHVYTMFIVQQSPDPNVDSFIVGRKNGLQALSLQFDTPQSITPVADIALASSHLFFGHSNSINRVSLEDLSINQGDQITLIDITKNPLVDTNQSEFTGLHYHAPTKRLYITDRYHQRIYVLAYEDNTDATSYDNVVTISPSVLPNIGDISDVLVSPVSEILMLANTAVETNIAFGYHYLGDASELILGTASLDNVTLDNIQLYHDTGNDSNDSITTDDRVIITLPPEAVGATIYYKHPDSIADLAIASIESNLTVLTTNASRSNVYSLGLPYIGTLNRYITYNVTTVPFVFELNNRRIRLNKIIQHKFMVLERSFKVEDDPDVSAIEGRTYPMRLAFSSDQQRLYILDGFHHMCLEVPDTSADITRIGEAEVIYGIDGPGTGSNQFNNPEGIAIDSNDMLYIADTQNHRVLVFDLLQDETRQLGITLLASNNNDTFNEPAGVAVDSQGLLYVVDRANHRIQIYTSNLQYEGTLGTTSVASNDNSHFNLPNSITIDQDDNLYISDSGNERIQIFDNNQNYIQTITLRGSAFDVAMDSRGYMYVLHENRLEVYTSTGVLLLILDGSAGNNQPPINTFRGAFSLVIDNEDKVWVADAYYTHRRILIYATAASNPP